MKRSLRLGLALAAALAAPSAARADPVETLRGFVARREERPRRRSPRPSPRPTARRRRSSSGSFDFARPNRFRFAYAKPFEQTIVGDGEKVWIYDADLNQVSSRKLGQALGATPAALLAGGSLERDFDLANLPAKDGLDWAEAKPKAKDGAFQAVRVGFKRQGPGRARDHRQLRPEVAAALQRLRRQRADRAPRRSASRCPPAPT